MLWRIALGLVVLGVCLCIFGVTEWRFRSGATDEPEPITLLQLIARGPAGNTHLAVSGVHFEDNFVYEYEGNENRWKSVWIPVTSVELLPGGAIEMPAVPRRGVGGGIRAIVTTSKVHNKQELDQFSSRDTVRGMVTNLIRSVGSEERKLLDESYPGTDWSKCIIIHEGRTPWNMSSILMMIGAGVVLALAGLGLLFAGWRSSRSQPAPRRRSDAVPEVLPADYDEQGRQPS